MYVSHADKNRNASPSVSGDKKSSLVDAVDPATSSGDAKLKPRSRLVYATPHFFYLFIMQICPFIEFSN